SQPRLLEGALALALAGADAPEESKALVQKVQELAEKATGMAKGALSKVQDSEAAQQARCPPNPTSPERLLWLREKLAELWKKTPAP
uniref:Uncharacterized protein n=1 Tax=Cyanoderma ruficeps TaxID=181631 RepID=A0A8C3QMV4_9PASS